MKHELWYDEENEIIHLTFKSDLLTSHISEIKGKLLELAEGKTHRQAIFHLSGVYKVENRETREQANLALKEANITDLAIVGGNAANRMIAKVLLKTGALKTKGDFFRTEEDAIKWIKSKRQ